MNERSVWWKRLGLLLLLLAILVPRLLQLGLYTTADEDRWLRNSANFYYALTHLHPAKTYQLHHPGVTIMYAGTAGLLLTFPEYRGLGQGYLDDEQYNQLIRSQGRSLLDILVASRFFMVMQTTVVLMIVFYLLSRLLGYWPALAAITLLALDPFYIGLTRLMHLDGLLTGWMLASGLACFVYITQGREMRFLLLSGFAAGLALLTKSPALFLFPYVGLLLLLDLYWQRRLGWRLWLKNGLLPLLIWLLLALGTFVVFWPALWVNPLASVADYFLKAFQYAIDSHHLIYFHGQPLPGSSAPWYFYLESVLWRATPVSLFGLALAGVAAWRRWAPFEALNTRRLALALVAFIFFFLLFLQLSDKKFDRYLLPLYAPVDILAALGWLALALYIKTFCQSKRGSFAAYGIIGLALAAQLYFVWQAAPYYFTYFNPLMGGTKSAPQKMLVGWGEGLNLAGEYLDQKPNAEELTVTSWYGNGPFSFYFSGRTYHIIGKSDVGRANLRYLEDSDYLVIYINQWQRRYNQPLLDVLAAIEPEQRIWIKGMEYARIYSIADIPPEKIEWLWQSAD